ncbi:MAG: M1 family aminopeptidase [Thermoanaerobaculia bacterium]
MLTALLRFEWRTHTRQPSFFAALALFLLVGFGLTASQFGPENVALTSPFLVMESLGLSSLFSVFAVAIFVSNAVLRDAEHRMEEIVFTTPIGRSAYLVSRFGGALAAAAAASAFAPLGMLIATRMPWIDAARLGKIHLSFYLWPYLVLVLPTLLFCTALLFAVATVTRSALATYTASVVIYLLYMACAALTNSPLMAASAPGAGGSALAGLLDPFGLSSFFTTTRFWTIAEKSTRFVALDGRFLLNRLLWVGVALAIFGAAYRVFSFRLVARTKRPRKARHEAGTTATVPYVRSEPHAPGFRASVAAFVSALKLESSSALRSRPFLLLLLLWFVLSLTEIRSDLFAGEYGSALYPETQFIVATLKSPLQIIGIIILIYYGAELFWREQRFRVASLIDATPVRGFALVLAKWSALAGMIAATFLTGILAGVVVQATHGFFDFQPRLYLSLLYFAGLPLVLTAAAAVAIHSLSPGKYAGLVLVLLFVFGARSIGTIGLTHPLWRFAGGPPVSYSALSGFSDATIPFGRLMLHWSVFSAGLLMLAAVSWRRLGSGAVVRLKTAVRHAATAGRASLAAILGLLAMTGGWVFFETSRHGGNPSSAELLDWKGAYEKRYRPLAGLARPRIEAVTTRVDLFPAGRRVHIVGDDTLMNDESSPIASLLVSVRRNASKVEVSLPAARRTVDAGFGMVRFELDPPLQPGARTTLHFDLTYDERGGTVVNPSVVANGSLVMGFLTFPSLGYRSTQEIADSRERNRRGLGAPSTPEIEDPDALTIDESADARITLDATVSTENDQTAIAPGRLVREWTAGSRRFFQYRTDTPIRNQLAFASARYAVSRRQAGGVEVSVFHHPAHAANVPAILEAATATLASAGTSFGAYPHRQLKLVEVPASWPFGAFALADTILLSEKRTMLVDSRDPQRLDLVARRVAHEIGHLWWGYQLVPATRGGALMLVESLAKYTELMAIQQKHGAAHVRRQLEYELDRYLAGRSGEEQKERPLANVGAQAYIYYGKGALVMMSIRDAIGEPALDLALRHLLEKKPDGATTLDLLTELRAVSSDEPFALIDAWLRKIVLYDFRVDAAQATQLPSGRFHVTVRVNAERTESEGDGASRSVPLAEAIDVALYRAAPDPGAEPDLLQRVALHSGANDLAFDVAEAPGFVAVDPALLRIDRNRRDNVRKVDKKVDVAPR